MPTGADFETLIINVGGIEIAGKMLKSKQGWVAYEHEFEQVLLDANGIDKFGFKILPGVTVSTTVFSEMASIML